MLPQVNWHVLFYCRTKSVTQDIRGFVERLVRASERVLEGHTRPSESRLRNTAIDYVHKAHVYKMSKNFSNQTLWKFHEMVKKITRKINAWSKKCFLMFFENQCHWICSHEFSLDLSLLKKWPAFLQKASGNHNWESSKFKQSVLTFFSPVSSVGVRDNNIKYITATMIYIEDTKLIEHVLLHPICVLSHLMCTNTVV